MKLVELGELKDHGESVDEHIDEAILLRWSCPANAAFVSAP